ncbi:MAG: hypothetical protein P8M30_08320 [Planctomycetaceae bacterium]|jgi:hypothetical protein|nr:hypothetical protein [bacterium]MDC0273638.1 hypothetical protein [Planctomycetaceae bacterium]MDG2389309.1 hypothetical protein [Planctomycetaceae bacterium]
MAQHEYKVLSGSPTGMRLMFYASEELKDEIGPGSYERKLNQLAKDGWEVINSSTTSIGNFLFTKPVTTTILRREQQKTPV